MAVRHQILRNLDAAWDQRGNRQVVAFFIVGAAGAEQLSHKWRAFCDETVSGLAPEQSLPHRSPSDRKEIARGFLGATTWGATCAALDIDYDALPDQVSAPG